MQKAGGKHRQAEGKVNKREESWISLREFYKIGRKCQNVTNFPQFCFFLKNMAQSKRNAQQVSR